MAYERLWCDFCGSFGRSSGADGCATFWLKIALAHIALILEWSESPRPTEHFVIVNDPSISALRSVNHDCPVQTEVFRCELSPASDPSGGVIELRAWLDSHARDERPRAMDIDAVDEFIGIDMPESLEAKKSLEAIDARAAIDFVYGPGAVYSPPDAQSSP